MLYRVRPAHRVAVLTALAAVLSATVLASADVPICAIPHPQVPAYAAGTANKLTWTIPSEPTGSTFVIEIATAPDLDPDGSFVDTNLLDPDSVEPFDPRPIEVPASRWEWEFTGLQERAHYYHMRSKPKAGTNGCANSSTESPWSNPAAVTIQDATKPSIEVATEDGKLHVGNVFIEGTVMDLPGPLAPSASGPSKVDVRLDRSVPPIPLFGEGPTSSFADVEDDGTWDITLEGVKPGVYTVTIVALDDAFDYIDGIGNESEPKTITVVVLATP